MLGLGLFTFGYAKGSSYLTNDPNAYVNCHVMQENMDSWNKSSHRKAVVCSDCHTPPGLIPKWTSKALNGFFHSLAFTTGRFPDNIRITPRNFAITDQSCLKCPEDITSGLRAVRVHADGLSCVRCHANVGHSNHAD